MKTNASWPTAPADHLFDVVVIGAGMGGYAAAIAASQKGASVLLLEKMAAYGGATALSGGAFSFAGTEEQQKAGIDDSEDLLRSDLNRCDSDDARAKLVELYVGRQMEVYRWLRALGVTFGPPVLGTNSSVPRCHPVSTPVMLSTLHEHFTATPGCTYLNQAEVLRIDRDDKGVARRLSVRIQGREHTVTASRGVVLASGGFGRGDDTLRRFAPQLLKTKRMSGQGSTGDGLRMGAALGGALADFGYIEGTFGAALPNYPAPAAWTDTNTILMFAIYAGGIMVNRDGKRFVDESMTYRKLGGICLEQPGAVAFQLFDQRVMDASTEVPVTRNFKAAHERGLVKRAESVAAAALLMGLPVETVVTEVENYNRSVRADRVDSTFGRTSILMQSGTLFPLEQAPYYIYACTTGLVATYAGLLADEKMSLVDTYGQVVPGLFLAGEVVGGFHGALPLGGSSICKAAIFGKTAGESAAAFGLSPP